ncbi:hypothetical protein H817_YJM1419N00370 [Saccharomyces cerevisiae YJM1419]|uniref:Conserved protein n=1 Tax=Saccharomyces cerevisiae (strain YJM789) TaxID=307796 RepID=A6ZSB5_YEAS7|nr:hypothetical protein H755_YJM326N00370 [Saccharomyces cerevisiae YJM326]AJT09255.1 hypothetical protein H767_YJM682N00370 [Saccharomyces cerevisiae YJM682]AJT09628.1 hypothetical protein H768_YJM683N00368 [Saccharomyces cerevisiae YJM683]AJT09998.1 hypothetical protein H769_YJM689N00369 [Saccharomyces cerevisiae YJM689]AJT14936.1 hypothetical protein H781_YJM1133N00370 [Saccharomyces cerevisiae YJM1133]AJT20153.1 hypothetical protein H795_YJM1326N00369 [Saccharomyces cerevisiae YJM1326]AJT
MTNMAAKNQFKGSSFTLAQLIEEVGRNAGKKPVFQYKVPRSIRWASTALAVVFLTYGAAYTDMSWRTAREVYGNATEEEKHSPWFKCKTFGPVALGVLPVILAAATKHVTSRLVTEMKYLPPLKNSTVPRCQLTRRTYLLGRPVSITREINELSKNKATKIFTGVGSQGMEDKATFVFFTVDEKAPSFFNKFYIFSRSGSVVKNDARILDCFFNSVAENKLLNRSILTQILSHTSAKTQFHSGNSRSSIKNIVKPK